MEFIETIETQNEDEETCSLRGVFLVDVFLFIDRPIFF